MSAPLPSRWAFLELRTNGRYNDSLQAYAAGVVEAAVSEEVRASGGGRASHLPAHLACAPGSLEGFGGEVCAGRAPCSRPPRRWAARAHVHSLKAEARYCLMHVNSRSTVTKRTSKLKRTMLLIPLSPASQPLPPEAQSP